MRDMIQWLTTAGRVWLRGGLVGLAVVLLSLTPLLDALERIAYDTHFAWRGKVPPKTPVVIVSIHEDSFSEMNLQWPWPRAVHAKFLDIVSQAKPAAIGFDLVWSEPSYLGPEDDKALSDAIARAGNVILGAAFTVVERKGYVGQYGYILGSMNPPLPVIRERAAAYGFVNFDLDGDAFVRWATLGRQYEGKPVSHFTVHLYRQAVKAGLSGAALPPEGSALYINYRGGPQTFETVPYHRVLSGRVDPEFFKGKIVLVGATSPILHDVFPTPFAQDSSMPGVEIHANVLETLFQGIPIRRAPAGFMLGLAVLAGLGAAWFTGRMRPLVALAVVAGAGLAYVMGVFAAFAWARLWVVVSPVPLALVLGYGATVVENFIQEQREKRRLSRFFSPGVVQDILRHKSDVNLSSARRPMTVLFSDIRGFTSISEKLTPEEVVAFLREYLTAMTDAVFAHGGTVDKYIGDAIMALYNVPFDQPNHPEQAVKTAVAFQERLRPLAERFRQKHGADLRCGVGIHTGEAVVGTIGAEQRLEYTAIGDTINLGSRLESITKDFKVPIIISESTYAAVKGKFVTRYLAEVTVKGKEIPVKIYAVEVGEGRREARIRVEGQIAIAIILEGEIAITAPIMDLNRGGLSVTNSPKEFSKGELVRLRFDLPGERPGPKPTDVDARVTLTAEDIARMMQAAPAGRPGAAAATPPRPAGPHRIDLTAKVAWASEAKAGFQFLDLTQADVDAIDAFLAHQKKPATAAPAPPAPRPASP